jgi:hypothetical protein
VPRYESSRGCGTVRSDGVTVRLAHAPRSTPARFLGVDYAGLNPEVSREQNHLDKWAKED